jgi:hypothetical protein
METDNGLLNFTFAPSGRNGCGMLTAKIADEVIHVETLNIGKSKARLNFIDTVCDGRKGIDRPAVEAELLKLAADLAPKPEAATEAAERPDAAALLDKMPEPVRAEACALLDAENLMQRVVADIGALGVAGEKELAATAYLVGTSRLLPEPLAAIVQGPTSSGKSYIVKRVASLFPPEAVITATQLTPQSLFYMQPGSLVHRFVVTGERSHLENDYTAEATRALREMLSDGRLSKLVTVHTLASNEAGEWPAK